jgi:hypothetical protein
VHTELPDQVYDSPVFQEIVLAGADLFSWINDLYSLDKEIACGIVSNLILVLQHERLLNRAQAFIAARALISDRVNDLLAAEERLPELIDILRLDTATQAAVYRYVAGIRDCIAGSTSGMPTAPAAIRNRLRAPTWLVALVGDMAVWVGRAVG